MNFLLLKVLSLHLIISIANHKILLTVKKIFFCLLTLSLGVLINSCNVKSQESNVTTKLNNKKDSLSYILGATKAKSIIKSGVKVFENLDKTQIINGFNAKVETYSPDSCLLILQKLFGKNYQDFNKKYAKEGSLWMGKMTRYAFQSDMVRLGANDLINYDLVKKGFADGLNSKDGFLSDDVMRMTIQKFMIGLNEKNGANMMAKAKQIKGAQIFDNGVVIETLIEGSGPMPGLSDDVKVHYILTSAIGDTIQNSYKMPNKENIIEPVALSLNGGVIPGWSFAIPKMKVGGTYRLYLPWKLAYGEQQGRESLCFVVELIARGKSGSFTAVMENKPEVKNN